MPGFGLGSLLLLATLLEGLQRLQRRLCRRLCLWLLVLYLDSTLTFVSML